MRRNQPVRGQKRRFADPNQAIYRNLPNWITVSRVPCALALLFTRPFSGAFYLFWGLCGLTDVLDGYLARKLGAQSERGAKLDSAADAIALAAMFTSCLRALDLTVWMWVWIGLIAFARLFALCLTKIKYGRFAILHTYANKATGALLFLSPALVAFFGLDACAYALGVAASLSALEEIAIDVKSPRLDRDAAGFWTVYRQEVFAYHKRP